MNFDQAFVRLLGNEGGYVNNPADPGGETNWGISKRSYPNLDIKALTQDQAKSIYMHDYWQPCRIELLPEDMQFDVFDAAVNSGHVQATKWLQMTVGTTPDGVIGPKTLAACRPGLSGRFNGYRLQFMSALPAWTTFGRGWANRIAKNLIGS
jgi:lysozyme family protein